MKKNDLSKKLQQKWWALQNTWWLFKRHSVDKYSFAARYGNLGLVERFVREGGSVNSWSSYNRTLLMGAIRGRQRHVIEFLLAQGADVNRQDSRFGISALTLAVFYTDSEILKLLIDAGANLDLRDKEGHTALSRACGYRQNNLMVKTLLEAGANPNTMDNESYYPLVYVVLYNDAEMVKAFLDAGANLQLKTKYGHTALHYAIKYGSRSVVEMLLQAGANPSATSNDGEDCLQLANELDRPDLMDLFPSTAVVAAQGA